MKLVIAIVNQEDVEQVAHGLNRGGFSSTRFLSQGSYLTHENTTFLIGVDEERVDEVKSIIRENVRRQEWRLPPMRPEHYAFPMDEDERVTVGGATIFVVELEQFQRI